MKPTLPHPFELKNGIHGLGVFIKTDIKKNTVLFKLSGKMVQSPTRTSVQIGTNKHIEDEIASHINHSCTPTAKVDQATLTFVSLRDLHKGDEITFNYNDNEDLLHAPFKCECCGKEIRGRKFI